MVRTLTTSLAALMLAAPLAAAPLAAFAQDIPSYAQSADEAPGDQQLRGRITDFDGGYNLTVRDERGFIDNVALHPGTIINPTGLTLAPGMTVSILGYNAGDAFAANEIDTPYTYSSGRPLLCGTSLGLLRGAGFSLAFFFGNPVWWHGNDFHGGYRYYGGARYYNDVHIRNVYGYRGVGGSFHGRAFVAPATRGGYYRGTVRTEARLSPHAQPHFAGPPIVHGYAHSNTADYGHLQSRAEARPQYHNVAQPQYHNVAQPQYHTEARPQYHAEARPQYHSEARPQTSAARPQFHSEARPQSHGEAHGGGYGGGHGHEGGHPH